MFIKPKLFEIDSPLATHTHIHESTWMCIYVNVYRGIDIYMLHTHETSKFLWRINESVSNSLCSVSDNITLLTFSRYAVLE